MTTFAYSFSTFVPYPGAIRSLYTGENSMVVRDLRRRGMRVAVAARLQAGKRTGRLAKSIDVKRPAHYSPTGAPYILVGSDLPYAYLHHEGTRPHIIAPNTPGGTLTFPSRRGTVHTSVVRHPGTRPNRYLTDNLRLVK